MRSTVVGLAFLALFAACTASPTPDPGDDSHGQRSERAEAEAAGETETFEAESTEKTSPPPSPDGACNATDPRATPIQIFVQPEAGDTPYVDLLASAKKTIRVYGYQMGVGGVLDTLKARAAAGVDVRVLLDGHAQLDVNQKYRTQLEAAGAKVQWSEAKFSYMHAKAMVVDDVRALVSTGNYSNSWIAKERNYLTLDTDPQDVHDLAALFDADWAQKDPDLACTRLVISPVNAKERILALIDSATKTLDVESMQFAETDVRDAVFARAKAGVKVRVLLANPSRLDANEKAGAALVSAGVDGRWLDAPGVHVKAIAVDGKHAYIGSENLSYTSLTKNREVGLILDDAPVLTTMTKTFETDWANATPFAATAK